MNKRIEKKSDDIYEGKLDIRLAFDKIDFGTAVQSNLSALLFLVPIIAFSPLHYTLAIKCQPPRVMRSFVLKCLAT